MDKEKGIGVELNTSKEKLQELSQELVKHRIKVRGRVVTGKVVSKDTHKSAVITWKRQHYIPKYERYEKRLSKISVHNPKCIDAQVGDVVKVMETRPMSKTKHFVIVQKLKDETNNS